MTAVGSPPRPRRASRRLPRSARIVGYLIAVAVNVAVLWVLLVDPGWRWVPFLSDDFTRVLGLVTLSFVISVAVNLLYVVADPRWVKQLGDALSAAVGAVVLLRLSQVFPFDLHGWTWAHTPLRVLLVVGCVGSAIGVLANLAALGRDLAAGPAAGDR